MSKEISFKRSFDMKFEKADMEKPVCPYCENELDKLLLQKKGIGLVFPVNVVYFCPHCKKVLGTGQSRLAPG
jgi:uncharacterized protein with PIN domain